MSRNRTCDAAAAYPAFACLTIHSAIGPQPIGAPTDPLLGFNLSEGLRAEITNFVATERPGLECSIFRLDRAVLAARPQVAPGARPKAADPHITFALASCRLCINGTLIFLKNSR